MDIAGAVRAALEPFVGPMVADTCVRATAISLGKMTDELGPSDLHHLEASIKKLLAPIAAPAVINQAINKLEDSVRAGVV